jgi:hypothetical protein
VKSVGIALALLAFAVGCQGDDWVIAGERNEATASDAGPGDTSTTYGVRALCPTARELLTERADLYGLPDVDARYAGTWSGALGGSAAAGFPSDRVELSLDASGVGHLSFVGAVLTEAEDPASAYLCASSADGVACGTTSGFVGGFSYPLESVTSRGNVLSFVIVENDPWGDWCALQPVLTWPDEALECGFASGVSPPGRDEESTAGCARIGADGSSTPIDCALMYTLRHCQCGTDACFASFDFDSGINVGLELSTDGESLRGSMWYSGDEDAASVGLARQRDP